jgi:hypothetical protein
MIGEETFHPDTRALLAYGRALAGAKVTPKKGGADHLLERLFVLERMADGRLPLRSFGSELTALFGRDLKEHDFASLFLAPDLRLLGALIDSAAEAAGPAIARVSAETQCGVRLGAEILLTPLKVDARFGERFLGMVQPLGGEKFLDGRLILRLRIGSLHPPEAKAPAPMRLVVVND